MGGTGYYNKPIPPFVYARKYMDMLKEIPIEWDRYTELNYPDYTNILVYGWIKRTQGKSHDFVLLDVFVEKDRDGITFLTSSAKYTKKIGEIFDIEHIPCKKVEEMK